MSYGTLFDKKSLPRNALDHTPSVRGRQTRFLPYWLPLLLGLALGFLVAVLVADEQWHFAIPLALLAPAMILFVRYPFTAVLIWLALFPFFIRMPSMAGRQVYWILHRGLIPLALLLVIVSRWLGAKKWSQPVRFGRAELAMVAFVGWGIANIFIVYSSPLQKLYMFYDRMFVPFCVYWLIRLAAPGKRDMRRFIGVAFVVVIIQSTIGLLAWFAPQVLPEQWLTLSGERTVGTFGNVAVFSSTLIFLSLLLLQYAMHTRRRWLRILFLIVVGVAFFCVFFTFSRGSWLGGVLVLLGLFLLYPKAMFYMTAAVAIVVAILSNTVLANEVSWAWERLTYERTAEDRIIQYNATWNMIQAKPLAGWGFDRYDTYDREFQRRVNDIAVRQDNTSHNTYLTLMAELGVVAFLLYVFPAVWWLIRSFKAWRQLPKQGFWSWSLLVIFLLAAIDHVVVSNFMDMIRFNLFGTTVWWVILGFIANVVYPYQDPTHANQPDWTEI